MSDTDPAPTSPISYDSSRTYRAEDDISRGGGGSRMVARLVTPFLAVIPWLLTMAGLAIAAEWQVRLQQRFETQWAWVLGSAAVFLVAALIWAALTAWSSTGTTLAGAATLLLGVALASPEVGREVFRLVTELPGDGRRMYYVVSATNFVLIGSLLLAAGLGAAGARRMRR